MARKTSRSRRAATSLTGNLMLAPAVAALRVPLLAIEAGEANPWRVETMRAVTEKTAAAVEGVLAAQMSLAWSASRFWIEAMSGNTPSMLNGVAWERAVHAALVPSGKTVRTNYNRLKGRG
jgi:hypothetical protein